MPIEIPLFDLVLPAVLALAILAWAWRRREVAPKSSAPARAAGAVAFGVGMIAAHASIFREIVSPFGDRQLAARDWIPVCIVAAMAFALASTSDRARKILPSGGAPLAIAMLVLLSMRIHVARGLPGIMLTAGVFIVALITWSALELSSERLRGPLPCLVLALACAGSAACVAIGASAAMGRMSASLAALFAAAAVLAWKRRAFTLSGGPAAIASIVLAACWINAWAFSGLSSAATALSCASIVVPAYAGIGPLATWRPASREGARVVLVLLLAGAAVWIARAEAAALG